MARYRVAVDTGGTFSDFVFFNEDSGEISITKVPSTPKEPFEAVLNGVRELLDQGVSAGDVSFFSHGTTVGTNALLEEKGAVTGLLVTEGFRGIYEVMEQSRGYGPVTYDLFFEKPRLLAAPYTTEEVRERVDFQGNALTPVDPAQAAEAIRRLKAKGVESVAVCFLFSFLNLDHELAVKEVMAEEFPEASLSLSCEVLPQIREFYRMSTTVINAYIAPVMSRYLGLLETRLREMGVTTPQLYIMQSNGGVSTFKTSARIPVATVLSGPAGGVISSLGASGKVGIDNIITFDMGGTSCDVALIHQGRPVVTTQGRINQRPISLPMLDIHTVSAGGGTIARIDSVGARPRIGVGGSPAGGWEYSRPKLRCCSSWPPQWPPSLREREIIMSNRNQRHVTRRRDGDWQVIKPHASRASAVEPTQSAAIARAREILKNDGGGELVIHGRDNRIRDSDTIPPGNDPFPPRDRA